MLTKSYLNGKYMYVISVLYTVCRQMKLENCFSSFYGIQVLLWDFLLQNASRMLMPAFAAKSSKKGVTFTVNDAEQSSLRMMTARRVHHLLTGFTKTIYSSNSEKVQLSDTTLISPRACHIIRGDDLLINHGVKLRSGRVQVWSRFV